MAKLKQIMTHKLTPEQLKDTAEEVAQKSGNDWVTVDSINQHNTTNATKELNIFEKIIRYLFVLHPYIGHIVSIIIPPILLLPIAVFALPGFSVFIVIMGAFVGFFLGSFIFPGLVSSCKMCGALKKCDQIYSYCLRYEEHKEKRISNNIRYEYLVRDEVVFCIYECKKCKARKIEILLLQKEKRI